MEPVGWIVLGVVLAVAEMFTVTLVMVMFAAGAFAAAIAAAMGAELPIQVAVFAAVSVASLGAVRPVLRRHQHAAREGGDKPFGVAAIEGATGLVLERIDLDHGMIKIGGEMWMARVYDATQTIDPGERVRVIEVKGATAMVWREE